MALQLAALVPVATSLLGGLFKSKKHYHLYYWDAARSVWVFVLDGHPDQVKAAQASYVKAGVPTAMIRNKGDKNPDGTLAPKAPPTGFGASSSGTAGSSKLPWILAGIAAAAALGVVLLKKKRRG
jgi:hypothetical protein